MRIISGTHKGRQIHPPSGLPVRPTTDFAKTGLFNMLANHFDFEALSALDLFSGTGNISIELASRGVKDIIAVEANFRCITFIKETVEKLRLPAIRVVKYDVFSYLGHGSRSFDLIFADPPYNMAEITKIPELVFDKKLLNDDGWMVIEHSKRTNFAAHPRFNEQRTYGEVNFSFFI